MSTESQANFPILQPSRFHFSLPWPPSIGHYFEPIPMGKRARLVIGKRAKEYRQRAAHSLMLQGLVLKRIDKRLAVKMTLHPPTKRDCDVDNYAKGILDALTKTEFWLDDKQVDDLRIIRGEVVKGGCVHLEVKPICEG